MTAMTILADYAKKRLKVFGKIAAGEHVEATVAEGAQWQSAEGSALRLRVLCGTALVAKFPLEEGDAWEATADGAVRCELNLNTIPAAKHLRFGGTCLFVLDDAENHTLYGMGEAEILPWPKERGADEPYNLDGYPDELAELQKAWEAYRTQLAGEWQQFQTDATAQFDSFRSTVNTSMADFRDGVNSDVAGFKSDVNADVAAFKSNVSASMAQHEADVQTAIDGKAEASVLQAHIDNEEIHVTTEDKAAWDNKVDKVAGKGLSANDFTDAYKNKLDGLENCRYEVVAQLPAAGAERVIYLVARAEQDGGNIYDEYIWITQSGTFERIGSTDIDLSPYYTKSEIDAKFEDLNYTPIAISAFSVSPASAEKGSTVTAATLSYTLNKAAASATLDGAARTLSGKTGTIALTGLSITANKTWTLAVTDAGSAGNSPHSATKTATLTFLNRVYWGAAAIPATMDSAFIRGLGGSELSSTRARTKTVNAGSGQYIWFAYPASYGAAAFKVGGFDGGFTLVNAAFAHTNASGYTENYRIYRSDNAGLGSTTVVVS